MSIRSTVRKTPSTRLSRVLIVIGLLLLAFAVGSLSAESAFAQQNARALNLGSDFNPTPLQIQTLIQGFDRTPDEKIFFHWTTPETGIRWIQQGHIDQGEVEFYNTPSGDRQVHGAGVYLASNPTSSSQFGEFCVVFKMPKGTLVYRPDVVKTVFGRDLNADEKTALGKSIPFIRDLNGGDWHITHSPANLNHVEYGGVYGADAKIFSGSDQKTMLAAIEKAKPYGDVGYLESFFHLMHYMDGIALQRAIRVAPSNPWSQFEPAYFENFKKLNQAALETKPITRDAVWGSGEPDRDKWVSKQIKETLPGLINALYHSSGANFRGHQIRAGGTRDGHTFYATPQDLTQLLSNPYLQVDYRPDGSGYGYLVSYNYPSIYTLPALKSLVSPDVFESLSKFSETQIRADRNLEIRLNQTLIENLIQNLLADVHGKLIDPADVIHRYISIHPYSDGNGRSGRLFVQKALNEVGLSLPPFYISDLDLLVSPTTLNKIIEDSNTAYVKLQRAMLSEFVSSGFGKSKMPDYFKLAQFQELITSLSAFGFSSQDRVDARYDHDILERRFNEVFVQMKGPAWSLKGESNLKETLNFARAHGAGKFVGFVGKKIAAEIGSLKADDSLEAKNAYLKNMMAVATSLREYTSLKKAYLAKITQIVRKLDYSKTSHFKILEQYKEVASPQEQRATLGFITRGMKMRPRNQDADWDAEQLQREIRVHFQISEMKNLIHSLLDGTVSPQEFSGRLARLDESLLDPSQLDFTLNQFPDILAKLPWNLRTSLLKRLNLANLPLGEPLAKLLTDLVDPLHGKPDNEATEYRSLIAKAVLRHLSSTDITQPLGRLLYDLWLHSVPNLRYSLANVAPLSGDLVHQRMIEILQEDLTSEASLTDENARALMAYAGTLLTANKRIPIDTKSWIKFFQSHQGDLEKLISRLQPVHFKSTLYYGLLEGLKDNDAAKSRMFHYISSNSRQQAGGEQLRLELLKEAERNLKPENYATVAEAYMHPAQANGFEKLKAKAGRVMAKEILAEFSKAQPDFSVPMQTLHRQPSLWASLSDEQIATLLSDQARLSSLVGEPMALKMSKREYHLLKAAIDQTPNAVTRETHRLRLRESLIELWSKLSHTKLKPEVLTFLLDELRKMAPISSQEAINISIYGHSLLDKKSITTLASTVKSDFLKQARSLVSGTLKPDQKRYFPRMYWSSLLTDVRFSQPEMALITQVAKMTSPFSMLETLHAAAPATAPYLTSDYVKAIMGAFEQMSKSDQTSAITRFAYGLYSRGITLERENPKEMLGDLTKKPNGDYGADAAELG